MVSLCTLFVQSFWHDPLSSVFDVMARADLEVCNTPHKITNKMNPHFLHQARLADRHQDTADICALFHGQSFQKLKDSQMNYAKSHQSSFSVAKVAVAAVAGIACIPTAQ